MPTLCVGREREREMQSILLVGPPMLTMSRGFGSVANSSCQKEAALRNAAESAWWRAPTVRTWDSKSQTYELQMPLQPTKHKEELKFNTHPSFPEVVKSFTFSNQDTYHMSVRRFTRCYPTPEKPRDLLLSLRSQWIIIMTGSNHQIKPIQMQSWVLYL